MDKKILKYLREIAAEGGKSKTEKKKKSSAKNIAYAREVRMKKLRALRASSGNKSEFDK